MRNFNRIYSSSLGETVVATGGQMSSQEKPECVRMCVGYKNLKGLRGKRSRKQKGERERERRQKELGTINLRLAITQKNLRERENSTAVETTEAFRNTTATSE